MATGSDVVRPELAWPPAAAARLRGDVVEVARLVPERDAAALHEALDDGEIWRHLAERPGSPQDHARVLARRLAEGRVIWLVRLVRPYRGLPAATVVGTSSYLNVSARDARLEIGATAYRRQLWATAVNPETKLLLLGYAFETLGAARVQLVTDERNLRSRRAIERLGATQEGILRSHQRRADGTLRDTVVFSILHDEWPEVRAGLRARVSAG